MYQSLKYLWGHSCCGALLKITWDLREAVSTDFVLCFSLHCGPISGHVEVVLVRVCF